MYNYCMVRVTEYKTSVKYIRIDTLYLYMRCIIYIVNINKQTAECGEIVEHSNRSGGCMLNAIGYMQWNYGKLLFIWGKFFPLLFSFSIVLLSVFLTLFLSSFVSRFYFYLCKCNTANFQWNCFLLWIFA